MAISPPRRLIIGYAILVVLIELSVALPGNVTSTFWGTVGRLLIEALVVWRLWHRSQIAWIVAVAFAVLTLPTIILMGGPMNPALVWLSVVSLAQAALLFARPVLAFVWSCQTFAAD